MKILLVEDDKDLSELVCFHLKREGYEITACYPGHAMPYYLGGQTYDLIILDRLLPGMDGLSLLELARNQNLLTPVIMVTALNGLNDRIDGLDAGADDYLAKPFEIDELSARIRALLQRPRKIESIDKCQYSHFILDSTGLMLYNTQNQKGSAGISLSKGEIALLAFL